MTKTVYINDSQASLKAKAENTTMQLKETKENKLNTENKEKKCSSNIYHKRHEQRLCINPKRMLKNNRIEFKPNMEHCNI